VAPASVNGRGVGDGSGAQSHYDFFSDKFNTDPTKGGQRIATMLMYLTSVEEGGETVFPASAVKPNTGDHAAGWSKCAQRGVAVKAKRGDAMLFWSLKPNGKEDTASLHAGCPVIRGTKWSATKWMHVGDFLYAPFPSAAPFDSAPFRFSGDDWNANPSTVARGG
jgi:prolyl 4-hydroxylase